MLPKNNNLFRFLEYSKNCGFWFFGNNQKSWVWNLCFLVFQSFWIFGFLVFWISTPKTLVFGFLVSYAKNFGFWNSWIQKLWLLEFLVGLRSAGLADLGWLGETSPAGCRGLALALM